MPDEPVSCIWDSTNNTLHSDNDDLGYNDLHEPWRNIIASIKTATANFTKIQDIFKNLKKEHKHNITSDNIAKALYMLGILSYETYYLHLTKTSFQLSSSHNN